MKNIELAKKILDELRQFYPLGLYEWLYKYSKDKYYKIVEIEGDLHHVISKGTEEQTKELLSKYWELHRTAIGEYINNEETIELEFEYTAIRREMLEERVSI